MVRLPGPLVWLPLPLLTHYSRGVTRFDASYSAAETMGEAEDGVESAGGGRTARGEITSEGALVPDLRRLRRSDRRTRRPDYYVP
jgi:hypothetical protein